MICGIVTVAAAVAAGIWWSRPEPMPAASSTAPQAEEPTAFSQPPPPTLEPPAPEDSVLVQFEDGTAIPIRVVFVLPLPSPVDGRLPLREQYPLLRRLAEGGDAVAARELYQLLSACLQAGNQGLAPDSAAMRRCEGVTAAQTAEALDWLQRAARGGDDLAAIRWADHLGNSQEGFEAWEALWRRGELRALNALARLYERGIPASTGGVADPVSAHAYQLVDFQVREAVYSKFQGLAGTVTRHADRLRSAGGQLNPQQHAEAQALAWQILSSNPNCCRGNW